MDSHEITVSIISGLALIVSGLASVVFSWLRSDIRALAEATSSARQESSQEIAGLRKEIQGVDNEVKHLNGILEGKGIL